MHLGDLKNKTHHYARLTNEGTNSIVESKNIDEANKNFDSTKKYLKNLLKNKIDQFKMIRNGKILREEEEHNSKWIFKKKEVDLETMLKNAKALREQQSRGNNGKLENKKRKINESELEQENEKVSLEEQNNTEKRQKNE